jgi:hypothetical protein
MFDKPLDKLTFEDIKKLKDDKIPESKILDYKREEIEKKELLQHICGFANADGGFLIFGIEEDDSNPPIPKNLTGLSKENFNIEQTEQIINGNIEPRLTFELSPPIYESSNKEKFFIVIRIPEGPDKPYMSNVDDRFYIRRNYQTPRMSEIEISSMYRQRFSAPETVKEYLKETIDYNTAVTTPLKQADKPIVFGHFFVFPTNVGQRRIENLEGSFLKEFPGKVISIKTGHFGRFPAVYRYNQFGVEWNDGRLPPKERLEVHRNGLIHNVKEYGSINEKGKRSFAVDYFTGSILSSLEYASSLYEKIGCFGTLTIMIALFNTKGIGIGSFERDWYYTNSKNIKIERECNTWELKNNIIVITKSMMDEFVNCFGVEKYWGFCKSGEFGHLLDSEDEE